ncbi:MAG: LptA/OstA family protein [Cyanobacteria bacterium J06623_4]
MTPSNVDVPHAVLRSPRMPRRLQRATSRFAGTLAVTLMLPLLAAVIFPASVSDVAAQSEGGAIQLKASRVEANSNTGVVTAIGNVRIDYPSRQIYATSAQAQYYSREQRIVLSGNVDVIQEGNTLQAETVTYLIEEGRFVAMPGEGAQVEAVYLLPEEPVAEPSVESAPPAPLTIPTPPDELPAELGPIDSDR